MAGPDIVTFTKTKSYSSQVMIELMEMREKRHFSDFTITINEETLPCHKLILAIHSPVLKAMLTTEMSEAATQTVHIDHINKTTMETLLDYMYSEQVSVHTDQLMDMITACDYLQMSELKNMCVSEVLPLVRSDNAIPWLRLSSQLGLDEIRSRCEEVMLLHFTEISEQPDFLAMNVTEVQEYVTNVVKADIDCGSILQAVMCWINHVEDNRLIHMESMLRQIPLSNCPLEKILDTMQTHKAIITSNNDVFTLLTSAMKQNIAKQTKENERQTDPMLVAVGGKVGDKVNRVCYHLNQSREFVKFCDIPSDDLAKRHSVCKTPQGFAVTGGESSDICMLYVAATKSWLRLQNMLEKRYCHGSICVKGVIFVFGGWLGDTKAKSVEYLALHRGRWESGPALHIDAIWPLVAAINDSLYVLEQKTKEMLELDVEKKIWMKLASFPASHSCSGATMISVNGRLCVAGGHQCCAWYDPVTNAWCVSKQQPSVTHSYGPLVHCGSKLLLLGGINEDTIEEMNLEDGTWCVSDMKMPSRIDMHAALVLEVS